MESPSSSESDYTTVWSAPPKKPSGRTKFRETRHPVYRGVRRRGNLDRWVCEVRNPNNKSRIWLGTFPTAEMAARAHDVAAMVFKGRSACLNFADSAWLITVPSPFSNVQDLKKAAVKIARTLHSGDPACSIENMSNMCPSTSSIEMVEEEVVISSQTPKSSTPESSTPESSTPESATNSVVNEPAKIDWYINHDEMNLAMYYASLAEGLMMEPPVERFNCFDDDCEWGAAVSLWS